MISNGPSRTFTREAVEVWLSQLSVADWERKIPETQLKEGRKMYREGKLSTIDLQTGQAIITQKIDREETYSVIEWDGQGPEIRTSVEDEEFGVVLAAAGLYEIEELIAEIHEDDPLFEEFSVREEQQANGQSEAEGRGNEADVGEKEEQVPLLILLEVSNKNGLTATPIWQVPDDSRIPAYGGRDFEIDNADRPSLMKFVAEASERGFEFDKEKGIFNLRDWKQVAMLTEDALPRWEKAFQLEFVDDAHLLREGQRTLSWEIEARSRDTSSMTLREHFRIGSHRLGVEHTRKVTRARNGSTFIRGHGLVRLDQNQLDDFEWWQRNRGDSRRANWPRYMLFSLFARKYLKARQDGKLADWQAAIRKPQTNGIAKRFSFLRPYQREGVAHLHTLHKLGCHGLLADEMGLGKTVQTLALIMGNKEKDLPDLVTCPASVVPVWVREAKERFPRLKVRILSKENQFFEEFDNCLWVASYTQLRRHRSLLEKFKFRYAVLDEAQLIKNPKAKVTQTCLSIDAKHRLALSGTPIENTALDLWTIFRFLMPGLLGSRKDLEKNLTEAPEDTIRLLRRQVTPFVLRRIKSEVATELPPKLETELPCPLNDEQRKEYRKLTEGAIQEHGEDLQAALKEAPTHVFSLLTRLRQTCCDLGLLPWRDGLPSTGAKGDLLVERLKDLSSSGAKVIVFSQFTSFLAILKKNVRLALPDLQIVELTGSTRDRSLPVEQFESHQGPVVMLASLKAAGLGVNLKSADYVFLMDPWWNPAVEEQAIDRAHRLGREKPTFIYRLVAQGTIEERVRNLQLEKKETFQKVIGEMDKPKGLADHFSSLKELIELKEN
jgi:SNF2 family DNA or RNA helicase